MIEEYTVAEQIRQFLWDHPFLIFLLMFFGIPGFAGIMTVLLMRVGDLIFGKNEKYAVVIKPSPTPEEKLLIRDIAISIMTRRGVSPSYAVELATDMVEELKKKELLL